MLNAEFENTAIADAIQAYVEFLAKGALSATERNLYVNTLKGYFVFSLERGFGDELLTNSRARDRAIDKFLVYQHNHKKLGPRLMGQIIDALDQFYEQLGLGSAELWDSEFQCFRAEGIIDNASRITSSNYFCEVDKESALAQVAGGCQLIHPVLANAILLYKDSLVESGLAEGTCRSYVTYAIQFLDFIAHKNLSVEDQERMLEKPMPVLGSFTDELRSRGFSENTMKVKKGAVERFLRLVRKMLPSETSSSSRGNGITSGAEPPDRAKDSRSTPQLKYSQPGKANAWLTAHDSKELANFNEYLLESGLASGTCRSYLTYVSKFLSFSMRVNQQKDDTEDSPDFRDLENRFVNSLRDKGLSESTVQVQRGAIEKFLRFSKRVTSGESHSRVRIPVSKNKISQLFCKLLHEIEVQADRLSQVATLQKTESKELSDFAKEWESASRQLHRQFEDCQILLEKLEHLRAAHTEFDEFYNFTSADSQQVISQVFEVGCGDEFDESAFMKLENALFNKLQE